MSHDETVKKIDFIRRSYHRLWSPTMAPMQLVGALYNWTDDLPVCGQAGIGYQINQVYSMGNGFVAVNDYEDRSFRFQCPDECYLYGVIDGHDGAKASSFAAQKLPAELLLGQLKDDFTEDDLKAQLNDSFDCLAKGFVEDLINDSIMEKIKLEEHLEGMDRKEAAQNFPTLFKDLEKLDKDIAGGCSAVIALVHKSKLYIANVGDCRALLCRSDDSGDLGLIQLSVDHTISTVSELQRLANLGIDIEKLQYSGGLRTTRSIGDWELKGGYKTNDVLSTAQSEPVLSTPSIHGGEKIDHSMKFLILMSAGVYKAYEEATGTPPNMINNNIASMVHQEINRQRSVADVAQAVIDEIGSLHYDQYINSNKVRCARREDMTLLVRLFNVQLAGTPLKPIPSVVPTSKLLQKSAKLAPLKMPDSKKNADIDSPNSTGSNTPTSVSYNNEFNITPPGSGGSGGGVSPHFSQPIVYPYRPLSPLTTTVVKNPSYQPLQVEVDEQFKAAQSKPEHRIRSKGRINVEIKAKCESPPHIPLLQRTGIYEQRVLEKDAGTTSMKQPCHDGQVKVSSNDALLMMSSDEVQYENAYDSLKSNSSGAGKPNEDKTRLFNRPPEPLETDQDGRIKAYVDFTELTNKINELGGDEEVFGELTSILQKI